MTTELREFVASMPYIAEMAERMGIELIEAAPDRLVASMRVEGNRQPSGFLFGGASAYLAEALGSIGATLQASPGMVAVGVDINATHHRAVTSGSVTATAAPLHTGSTTACWEIVITDEAGRRVCTARITNLLIPVDRIGA